MPWTDRPGHFFVFGNDLRDYDSCKILNVNNIVEAKSYDLSEKGDIYEYRINYRI